MSHHHHHHNTQSGRESPGDDRRLVVSVVLNLAITVAEIVGGLLSGSLALLSDAIHNLSDTASLAVSLATRRVGRRAATRTRTFGYRRAEILGAFVNLVTLVLVALFLIQEAVSRFAHPEPIDGSLMMIVAVIGLLANFATALLLRRQSKDSLNVRSAFLHILADGISSVGVVIGSLLIIYFDFTLVDPILTVVISCYLLYHSYHMLRETTDILMEGVPEDVDLDRIAQEIQRLEHVRDVHHIHVWQLDETHRNLEAHIVMDGVDLDRLEAVKRRIKELLARDHRIGHSTLEFEFSPCTPEDGAECFEHA